MKNIATTNASNSSKLHLAIIMISTITACVFIGTSYFVDEQAIKLWLNAYQANSLLSILSLGGLMTLLLTIGMPRQLAAFAAGYCFGTIQGAIFATFCATIACWCTLSITRVWLADLLAKKYPDKLNKVQKFFATDTFVKAVIIRILPIGSNFLTNVLAGVAKSPRTAYVLGSGVGFLPQMTIFSLAGAGIKMGTYQHIYLSAALLLTALLLGSYLYKKSTLLTSTF